MPYDPLGLDNESTKDPLGLDEVGTTPLPEPENKEELGPRIALSSKEKPKQEEIDPLGLDNLDIPADMAPDTPVYVAKALVGSAEATMSLASSALLFPFSKVFGLAALTDSKDEAVKFENMVMNLGYKPYTKEGRAVTNAAGFAMEKFLWPATKVKESFEEFTPHIKNEYLQEGVERLGWLMGTGVELSLFAIAGEMPGLTKQAAMDVKLAREMKHHPATAGMKPEGMGLIRTTQEPIAKPGETRHTGTREKWQITRDGEVIGEIGGDTFGDTIYIDGMENSGAKMSQPEIRELFKQLIREETTAKRAVSYRTPKYGHARGIKEYKLDQYRARWRAQESKAIREAATKGLTIENLMRERSGNTSVAKFESEVFIQGLVKRNSVPKLEAIPFLIEKIDPAMVKKYVDKGYIRPEVGEMIRNPGAALLKDVALVRNYYKQSFDFLSKNWDNNISWVDNYVTHVWDIAKNEKLSTGNYFIQNNPWLKHRTIPTLIEGMKLGLKPKSLNIADLLRLYDSYKIRTVYNAKFVEGLKATTRGDGTPRLLASNAKNIPSDYVQVNIPALNRGVYRGKTKTGEPVIIRDSVMVDPQIANELKIVFDKPFDGKTIAAIECINSVAKKTMLSLSLFHHLALTEAALATGIGIKAMKQWNPKAVYNSIKNGDWYAVRNMPLVRDAIKQGGLTIEPLPDYHIKQIEGYLREAHNRVKGIPVAEQGVAAVRAFNKVWDQALWQHLHTNLKLMAYEHHVTIEMKKMMSGKGKWAEAPTPHQIKMMKREVGAFVNDSFGGQNWDLMGFFGTPKAKQVAGLTFLAPDWTLSTVKQGVAPITGLVRGKYHYSRAGARFVLKSAMYYTLISQSLNYFNTGRIYGWDKARTTLGNPEGKRWDIFLTRGSAPDSPELYLRIGKQFREIPEWIWNFWEKLGGKMSPVAHELIKQAQSADPGSSYPAEWAEDKGLTRIGKRLLSAVKAPLPFSLRAFVEDRPVPFLFSIPVSVGMSKSRAVKQFKEAIALGDEDRVREIYVQALQNGINAEKMVEVAANAVGREVIYDNRKLAKEIAGELHQLKTQEQRDDLISHYEKTGVLNQDVFKQLLKELEDQQSILDQQKAHGIGYPGQVME